MFNVYLGNDANWHHYLYFIVSGLHNFKRYLCLFRQWTIK